MSTFNFEGGYKACLEGHAKKKTCSKSTL